MSKYTLKGSSELDKQIDADMARIAETTSPHSIAGVLIGGYGRGEGTPFIHPDGLQAPFNDYDLVVVVDKLDGKVRQKFRALEKQLTDELGLPVDLCPYQRSRLRRSEFSLLNYEMKHGHKVVWGDENILATLPGYPHSDIPLSEGSRLLLNRGKLLLDIQQRLADVKPLTEEERIRFIKFIYKARLAFGDCALLAAGQYDISYAIKKVRFPAIGYCPDRDFIVDGYLRAIKLKEWGDFQALENFDFPAEFTAVRDVFLRFLPWYRSQYSARECPPLKAVALNLKWNNRLDSRHPREHLYDAIIDLLQSNPGMSAERFYELQRRFS
ncbi:MAG: hypothetical protein ABFR47_03590 [Verrucomicrobiota bacterium]